MKVRPSVKPICEKCKIIKRKGRVMVKYNLKRRIFQCTDVIPRQTGMLLLRVR